jgi:hypothetical protein
MTTGMLPLLPTSQNDPSGLGRVEAFWNSFSCDRSIAVLQSVPAFLLSQTSVGPRSSGEIARQHGSGRKRGVIRSGTFYWPPNAGAHHCFESALTRCAARRLQRLVRQPTLDAESR